MHMTASGQDFWHSGVEDFWSGQQGMPSATSVTDIAADWLAIAMRGASGVAKRPTIASSDKTRVRSAPRFTRNS